MKKPNKVSMLGRAMAGTLLVPGKRSMMSGVHELCRAVEIVPRHQSLEAFHQDHETKPRVLALIRDQYRLLPDGSLRVKKEKDSGPLRSLYSEPKGKSNKRGLRSEIAIKTVRRLLGFVL